MTPLHESPPLLPPHLDRALLAADPASAVRALIAERDAWFRRGRAAGCDALAMNRASSQLIDAAVGALYERARSTFAAPGEASSAVFALGGYGREEMGPACDIDLLFLIGGGASDHARSVTDAILYPFWDSGIEIGGATRTLDDCRVVIGHDVRALTAMLDGRRIAGEASLEAAFASLFREHFAIPSARRRFVEEKIAERRERRARAGMELSALQPNVKEGAGGLRDSQTLLWASRALHPDASREEILAAAVPDEEGRARFAEALRFLWEVRNALQLAERARNDRMGEALQEELARALGFVDEAETTALEGFMAAYYRHAEAMEMLCERGMALIQRELVPPSRLRRALRRRTLADGIVQTAESTLSLRREEDAGDELAVLRLFAFSRKRGQAVDPVLKAAIVSRSRAVAPAAGLAPEAARELRELFGGTAHLDRTLLAMHHCGVLARFFPEIGPLFSKVQHDGLHVSTAGIHSIAAVGELARLCDRASTGLFTLPSRARAMVKRPTVLALVVFLHDVGKGRGGDHAEKGGALALAIARRLGLSEEDAGDIAFLVRSHLLMSTLAFRRDVRDPMLLARFAQSFRSPELLAMLYLLTLADLRAVSHHAWSEWKGGLLAELFERTLAMMTEEGMSPERQARDAERLIAHIRRCAGSEGDERRVREFLAKLPERYQRAVPPETIAAHLLMMRELGDVPVATFVRDLPERGCTEFSIVTRDAPGLFAKIAGVLSAGGANIVDAALSTSTDGIAIDVLWLTDALHHPFADPLAWERIRAELSEALAGTRELSRIVGGRFKRRLLSWGGRKQPAQVTIENDVSALYTVLEIAADDRRGLLYTIAATLHELGLSIDLARITTHVDRVTDVFYIKDSQGGKISSRERLDAIKERLREALEE